MENNELLFRKKKKQSLDTWVNETCGMVYEFSYIILIKLSRAISDVYLTMDR